MNPSKPNDPFETTWNASEVVDYWLSLEPSQYFQQNDAFDERLRVQFKPTVVMALNGELDHWAEGATGMLALILLLDQMPRNLFRGSKRMYQGDAQAQELSKKALTEKLDQEFATEHRKWFYMPLMHSEMLEDQHLSVAVFEKLGPSPSLDFAYHHRDIVQRFGRFPHRNTILGRESTHDEVRYLQEGGFAPNAASS